MINNLGGATSELQQGPLIASDLAADKKLKQDMTSLEYFKKYIAPIIEEELEGLDVTVYYL